MDGDGETVLIKLDQEDFEKTVPFLCLLLGLVVRELLFSQEESVWDKLGGSIFPCYLQSVSGFLVSSAYHKEMPNGFWHTITSRGGAMVFQLDKFLGWESSYNTTGIGSSQTESEKCSVG